MKILDALQFWRSKNIRLWIPVSVPEYSKIYNIDVDEFKLMWNLKILIIYFVGTCLVNNKKLYYGRIILRDLLGFKFCVDR